MNGKYCRISNWAMILFPGGPLFDVFSDYRRKVPFPSGRDEGRIGNDGMLERILATATSALCYFGCREFDYSF
jgi:hypothetical protein